MIDLIAIDPGYSRKKGGCACAGFAAGVLVDAWIERPATLFRPRVSLGSLRRVVVEQPQQDGRSWAVPPSVLIRLAWDGSALAHLYAGASGATVVAPSVADWKGSEAKPQQHWRAWDLLTPAEQAVLGGAATLAVVSSACERGALERWRKPGGDYYPDGWTMADKLDAVALGLWALGRMKSGRARPQMKRRAGRRTP